MFRCDVGWRALPFWEFFDGLGVVAIVQLLVVVFFVTEDFCVALVWRGCDT